MKPVTFTIVILRSYIEVFEASCRRYEVQFVQLSDRVEQGRVRYQVTALYVNDVFYLGAYYSRLGGY